MEQKIYIASTERSSGKTLVALGLLHALRGIIPRVGYMKPIGQRYSDGAEFDDDAMLIRDVLGLSDSPKDINPLKMESTQGDPDALYEKVFGAYERIAADKDIVVIEGTDYTSSVSALEFDINAELAKNMVAPVLLVANGFGKSVTEIVQTVEETTESLRETGCNLLGVVINRCDSPDCERDASNIRRLLKAKGIELFGTIPPNATISGMRLKEVAEELDAMTVLQGDDMNKVVTDIKVLAMTAENALSYMKGSDGCLLITPGDRVENILASLLAQQSSNYPRYAGLLLTGGLVPGKNVRNLFRGMASTGLTVLSVDSDTYHTALKISGMSGSITIDDKEKLDLVYQMVERYVDTDRIIEQLGTIDTDMVTPAMFQYRIIQKARSQRKHIVLPEGTEPRVVQAAAEVLSRGICDLTLLGNEEAIYRVAADAGVDISGAAIIDPSNASAGVLERYADALYELRKHKSLTKEMALDQMAYPTHFATMMVKLDDADGFVSGATHSTAETLGPVLRVIKTAPGVSLASSVFFMAMPSRVLVYADCALVQNPNAEQLADIAITSADTAQAFGIKPYVAMLSYSTGQSGAGEDVDKVRKAAELARKRRPDLALEGPIQYDAAFSAKIAQIKTKDSEVAGRASVYIFPDLDAGNTAYKAVQQSANVPAIGPIMQGLAKPANDLSRGAQVVDIVYTIAITAIQAQ